MFKSYRFIENPIIYAIYRKSYNTLFISTNPEAVRLGVIYIVE